MSEKRNLIFSSALENICSVNSSFDKAVLRVAYPGENRNHSYISKPSFEACAPTIYNCPIVCNYIRESDSIGGHDVEVVSSGDFVKLVNVTQPVGVVPESAKWWWQEITEDDGTVREYFCVEVLLWKRQEAYAHLKQNGITDQSMEVNIISGKTEDDSLYHIYQFEFTAFCLLERDKPCFESAGLETFSRDYFREQYSVMMEDFKREFAKVNAAPAEEVDVQKCSKGGMEEMNLSDLMIKYGLVEDDISFDTTDMSVEDLEAKFAEIKAGKDESENVNTDHSEPEVPENEPENKTEFSLTNGQLRGELYNVIANCKYQHPEYGMVQRYWLIDFDAERGEVYVEDWEDYRIYGLTFTMNGDNPVVDFENRKRKKVEYADWAEGGAEFSLQGVVEEVAKLYSDKIAMLEKDNTELKQFKDDCLRQERCEKNAEIINRFAELSGNEMFESLKEKINNDCYCMTVEEIEDKCFSIRGRFAAAQFSMDNGAARIPVENISNDELPADEPYGGIFVKYSKNRK